MPDVLRDFIVGALYALLFIAAYEGAQAFVRWILRGR